MLVRPGFEPATSRSADRRSPDCANQMAEFKTLGHCYLIMEILTNLVRVREKHFTRQKPTSNFAIRHYSSQFEFLLFWKAKSPQFREMKGYKLD